MSKSEREIRLLDDRVNVWQSMTAVMEKLDKGKNVTVDERKTFDGGEKRLQEIERDLDLIHKFNGHEDEIGRSMAGKRAADPEIPEVEGRPNEILSRGQSVRQWFDRAQENGVTVTFGETNKNPYQRKLSSEGRDRDLNRFWGEKLGLATPSVESRGLLEDTGGSAQAITPQAWVSDYIDVLLPNTILGQVGARVVPMPQESVTIPVFTSTVSPSWLAEAGSISLDANPAFAPLLLFATGGFKDVTQFSVEAAQDAYIKGNLDGMLANAVARKMQVVLDTSMLLGVAGNTGIPGLNGETNFVKRHYTGDAGTTGKAPTDTTELGVVVEVAKKVNATPNAFVSNVGCQQAFQRLAVSAEGRYWDTPSIADECVSNWVTSETVRCPTRRPIRLRRPLCCKPLAQ